MLLNRSHLKWQIVVAVTLLCHAPLHGQAINVPFLAGRVNDTAGMLSAPTIADLETWLKTHEDSTSNQVVVLTVPFLGGAVLEEYSMKVAETWKLGQADKDNGVLLLIARDDRMVRIEVGSGLEGALPDITCGHIIRNEIVPRFRDGNFDAGVRNGVKAILREIEELYSAEISDTADESRFDSALLMLSLALIVFAAFLTVGLIAIKRMRDTRKRDSILPGKAASLRDARPSRDERFAWWALTVANDPSRAGSLAPGKKRRRKSMGGIKIVFSTEHSSGGGWSSGESSSSGGGSGGGFSGGGGSFSGGGASGKW